MRELLLTLEEIKNEVLDDGFIVENEDKIKR